MSDDVFRHAFLFLTAQELTRCCSVSKHFMELAEEDLLWEHLCEKLWCDNVVFSTRPELSRKYAYHISLVDSRRVHLTLDELMSTIFSFRFREGAGELWTSSDPWWQDSSARRVRFTRDGLVMLKDSPTRSKAPACRDTAAADDQFEQAATITQPDETSPAIPAASAPLVLKWRLGYWRCGGDSSRQGGTSIKTRKRQAIAEARLMESLYAQYLNKTAEKRGLHASQSLGRGSRGSSGVTPKPSDTTRTAFLDPPPDEKQRRKSPRIAQKPPVAPDPNPSLTNTLTLTGDCLQISVNGIPAPSYLIKRLPNWGTALISSWAMYTNFPMPLRQDSLPGLDEDTMPSTEDQSAEIDLYNSLVQQGEAEWG